MSSSWTVKCALQTGLTAKRRSTKISVWLALFWIQDIGRRILTALEWNTLRFGNQEEDKHDRQQHHGCEKEVNPTAVLSHAEKHLRREPRDNEVPVEMG